MNKSNSKLPIYYWLLPLVILAVIFGVSRFAPRKTEKPSKINLAQEQVVLDPLSINQAIVGKWKENSSLLRILPDTNWFDHASPTKLTIIDFKTDYFINLTVNNKTSDSAAIWLINRVKTGDANLLLIWPRQKKYTEQKIEKLRNDQLVLINKIKIDSTTIELKTFYSRVE